MNKQRKVVITTTYNEMGIIIDTKAEEVAQPNLQPTCNQLATDTISRQAAIDALTEYGNGRTVYIGVEEAIRRIEQLPLAQPEETCDTCKHGYFGDEQCNDCRVRFTSHYERRNDGSD